METEEIKLTDGTKIPSLKQNDTIRYLGVDFNTKVTFDSAKVITNLNKMLQNLVSTPMLRPHQKILIINDYLWPTLIYPLQMAPLTKLPKKFLQDVDLIIRSSVKEILGIPNDVPNAMLYAAKKHRGLSISKAEWEAYLQHINVCMILQKANDPYIPHSRDLNKEIEKCNNALSFSASELELLTQTITRPHHHHTHQSRVNSTKLTKLMRDSLREKEFQSWSKLTLRGKGIEQFADNPTGNKSLMNKIGMTTSEYITMLKMNANVTCVRSIPGRSIDSTQCRHCGTEKETLGHVLGFCYGGELIRNQRHHGIRGIIAKAMKQVGFEIAEEVHCVAENGSNRRVDIIAYKRASRKGVILDPTVCFEHGEAEHQAMETDLRKKEIYEPCRKYLNYKYDLDQLEVICLYIEARGTIKILP